MYITREEAKAEVGKGWNKLIDQAYNLLDHYGDVRVLQVKEKFGGLRIYISTHWEHAGLYEYLDKIESESLEICEYCGRPGRPYAGEMGHDWVKTVCEFHKNWHNQP